MKGLCFKLVSLILITTSNQQRQKDQLDQAAAYIKTLRERIQDLKRRKSQLMDIDSTPGGTNNVYNMGEPKLPILNVKDLGSDVEVDLVSGLNKNFMLHQVIRVLEQEGAQVNTVSISTIGDKISHTLHTQVKVPRVGVDASGISDRIHEIIS